MKQSYLLFVLMVSFFTPMKSWAECNLTIAQDLMIRTNALLGEYSKASLVYIGKNQEVPAELQQTITDFAEQTAEAGIAFSESIENPANSQPDDPIDENVCTRFEELLATYALPEETGDSGVAADVTCTQDQMWERWSVAFQRHNELFKAGDITKEESVEYSILGVEFGQAATSDLAKACQLLAKYEQKLAEE
jgi:hypothetical protein